MTAQDSVNVVAIMKCNTLGIEVCVCDPSTPPYTRGWTN